MARPTRSPARCLVGASGWSYPEWGGGRFYPSGMKPGEWLAFYARGLPTVEINATFYRLPRPGLVARWASVVPEGFLFAVKLWRRITHFNHLRHSAGDLRDFADAIHALGAGRGPLLVQLPPTMGADAPLLDAFLHEVAALPGDPWRVAVEFRHPGWRTREVDECLDRHGAAVCVSDIRACVVEEPAAARFVYVRRHGPGGRYGGAYGDAGARALARRARAWMREGRDVHVYFNNTAGEAIEDALRLQRLLRRAGPQER
jgi:uncharacterized protein YecE (DUF72 family)